MTKTQDAIKQRVM